MLRNLPNSELIRLYDSELILKLHNAKNLRDTRNTLSRFMSYLGAYPPSPELAKGFLSQYADRKARTLYRYTQMLRGFMKWYGEPMDDVKIKVPKTLPPYTEDSDIEKLLAVIPKKRSHKGCIERDQSDGVVGLAKRSTTGRTGQSPRPGNSWGCADSQIR